MFSTMLYNFLLVFSVSNDPIVAGGHLVIGHKDALDGHFLTQMLTK